MQNPDMALQYDDHQRHDQRLLAQMAARNDSALSEFYDRYNRLIYSLVLRVVGSAAKAEAEEVVLDVFWQVWQQAGHYDARRGSILAWLMTIARTRAIDRRRRLVRQGLSLDADRLERPKTTEPAGVVEDAIFTKLSGERVRAAIGDLSEPQRRAIEMAYFEGRSQSEIAAALNKPLGSVKTHIRTGLARLRERLGAS